MLVMVMRLHLQSILVQCSRVSDLGFRGDMRIEALACSALKEQTNSETNLLSTSMFYFLLSWLHNVIALERVR